MRTLTDIIVAERDPSPEKSPGGIWFALDWQKQEEVGVYYGRVKVAGPDCKELKVGDHIMYHRSNYVPMEHEGQDFAVFHEHEVLALLVED
jgi:co-chaperonin GroES (HSP10)